MSLRWFAFDADAYTGDTAHLTCEEHGAYLLLILAYYRSEKPLPATDRALSSITKLPMDRWIECKPTLAAFFVERAGVWHHERIEKEMLEAQRKHSVAVARAEAGGRAKAAKTAKATTTPPKTPIIDQFVPEESLPSASSTTEQATSIAQECLEPAHLHLHLKKDSLSARANEVLKEEVPPEPTDVPEQGNAMPISRTFTPSPEIIERIMREADLSTIHLEIQKFVFHHLEQGSFSCDWQASFEKWWTRFVEHHKKTAKPRAAPRIEVNTTTTEVDWDRQIARWLKNSSMWSHKLCGPEPGQSGCRVPLAKLQEFNIDPATGIVRQPVE